MNRFLHLPLVAVLLFSFAGGLQPTPHVFYVSPDGSDTASGLEAEEAFLTLVRARDAVRELRQNGSTSGPVTVYLLAGTHRLAEPLELTPDDSGTPGAPITWMAYPGEQAVISGAQRVSEWYITQNGLWSARLPQVAADEWYFTTLYVNGQRRPRTRLPRVGYYQIVDYPSDSPYPWRTLARQFTFASGEIRDDWKNLQDVEVVSPRYWVSSRQHIASVNADSNIVRFAEETRYRYSDDFSDEGARYYVENVSEALDEPGEWYLDRSDGTLTYVPRPGEDIAITDIEAPVARQLVRIEGDPANRQFVSHVRFEGITFTMNNWQLPGGNPGDGQSAPVVEGAFTLRGAQQIAVENCRFEYLSSYAIQINEGSRNNRFVGNELAHLGGGGFRIGGGDARSHPDLRTGENLLADNHIHHVGEIHHSATGIWIQHSGGNTITHNEIDHTYYSSIAIGWVWGYRPSVTTHNEISFNHLHHVGQGVLSDMGGIYMLGVAPGTVVRNNLIHDIESFGYGGWGIYTDEGSSHVLIEDNIVYRTKSAAFDQHYGHKNIVRNNILAFAREDMIHRSRVEEHISFFVERNIIYARGDTPMIGGVWDTKTYLHRPEKPWYEPVPDSLNHVFDYNLYFNPDKSREEIRFDRWSFSEWQSTGQDVHSLYADPLFARPDNSDFTLAAESPAFALGFEPIDMSTVGPRTRLPGRH